MISGLSLNMAYYGTRYKINKKVEKIKERKNEPDNDTTVQLSLGITLYNKINKLLYPCMTTPLPPLQDTSIITTFKVTVQIYIEA